MRLAFTIFILLAGSFFILRHTFLRPAEQQQSGLGLFFTGIVTWVFIASAAAWLLFPFYLLYVLFVVGNLNAIMQLLFVILMTGVSYQINESIDGATVLHFIRESAFFRPARPQYMHIQEELDKHRIREVHRETSDKPFPTAGKQKRLLTEKEIHQYKQELTAANKRPPRSHRYEEELMALKAGEMTSIADAWKVYTFDHSLHDFYPEMSQLQIGPDTRTLQFDLNIPRATEQALRDPQFLYQIKQEFYHLLSVLHTDPWLAWYSEFLDRFTATCYGIESDSFGHTQLYPFLKIDIARQELQQREGKFFNAADLHKISSLTFNNGKPLTEAPQ